MNLIPPTPFKKRGGIHFIVPPSKGMLILFRTLQMKRALGVFDEIRLLNCDRQSFDYKEDTVSGILIN